MRRNGKLLNSLESAKQQLGISQPAKIGIMFGENTTTYERIRQQFNSTATCRHGNRPALDYEPGCAFIQCERGDACKCQLLDGEGGSTTALLIEWRARYAAR